MRENLMAVDFIYQELLPLGADQTDYRLLTHDYVSTHSFEDRPIVKVAPEGLTLLAETAFKEVSHFYRRKQIQQLAAILSDPEASDNDRFVALEMIKNAVIAAEGIFPLCQDTGTAVVLGKKGQQIWTGYDDGRALSQGVFQAYTRNYFRYSQNAPLSMYEEKNTECNLPAQIDLYAVPGDSYQFLFIAKGGGSSNKTFLFQETKAILNPEALVSFMIAKMKALGTAACPPYHLAFVVGGTSPETNLKILKLATSGYLDSLPETGNDLGRAFRDKELEEQLLKLSQASGIGAQFGGKYFCLDVRVIRLPRHGASCPISLGVSCSADRNVKAKITAEGLFLEKLETNPAQFLPQPGWKAEKAISIDLEQPMDQIRAMLSRYPVATALKLNGRIIVARDMAHAKLKERLDQGEDLPQYFKDHIIYYAGPAKTPPGYASGSLGPTTAGRMDSYVPIFQQKGGSLIMLAKGNRTPIVREACKKYGGFYLGSIGGPAARLAKDCIQKMETMAFPELGMEAIFRITVKDFPAFIVTDDKGHDFFDSLLK
jgi:fumarate hydratase class I